MPFALSVACAPPASVKVWPAMTFCPSIWPTLRTLPASGSLSLDSTSIVTGVSSAVVAELFTATGRSLTAETVTLRLALEVWVSAPSCVVAVTVRLNAPLKLVGGVRVRFAGGAPANVHAVPSPFEVPAESTLPAGRPESTTCAMLSPGSAATVIGRGIAPSSDPSNPSRVSNCRK